MGQLTKFLEDEGFYSNEKNQVKISVSIEELRVIIVSLEKLKYNHEQNFRDYDFDMEEEDIARLRKDIKFVESLHSDLVQTLNLELENSI